MNVEVFQLVEREEYNTVFDFYVNQLGFQYIKVDINNVHQQHRLLSEGQVVIERLQCGTNLIIYVDDIKANVKD